MKIERAAETLQKHINDPNFTVVVHRLNHLVVRVNWVYPVAAKIVPLKGKWEGYEVWLDRRGCW